MEAHRSDVQQAVERGRQHVLAGVLLHVLEAAGPVDPPAHQARLDLSLDEMNDAAVVFVDDLDDASGAERARIERLAARGRVKGRAIEHDGVPSGISGDRLDAHDGRLELGRVRIGVVDALGHGIRFTRF